MAKLGFIGLGVMGGNMVARLLDKGHTVTGYNRTRSKAQPLIDKGMQWADSPAAVCAASDVVFSMVTNSSALAEVADAPNGVLAGINQEMSGMPPFMKSVAKSILAKKYRFIEFFIPGIIAMAVMTLTTLPIRCEA